MEYDFNYLWECVVLFSENDNEYVSGPGIEQLVSIGFDMYHRGAPTEFDNQGFNKGDFTSFISMMGQLERDSIPASLAIRLLNMLAKYKNTQVHNYDSIYKLVQQDFAKLKSHVDHAGSQTTNANKVIVYPQKEYNKNKVYIPIALDRSSVMKINVEIDGYFSSINQQKEVDNYGKLGYPRWKVFSKDKNQINIYWINPTVLKRLEGFFKSKGLEIEYQGGIAPIDQPATQNAQNNKNQDINVIGLENHPDFGRKIAITFNIPFDRSKTVFDELKNKGLSPSGIAYQKNPSRFLVAFNVEKFAKIIEVFKSFNLNTENLEKFHSENKGSIPEPVSNGNIIVFIDDSEDKLRIKPSYATLSTEQKQFLKQLIQYTFPGYIWDGRSFTYSVKGTYKQYVLLGKLLKKFNYNVDDLRKIIASKIQKGFLQQTSWEGQYDDDEKFYNEIEAKTPNSVFDLNNQQKTGIAFLYGRDSAILGDETGFGKCINENSYVQTTYGVFKIKDLWDKFAKNITIAEGGEWAEGPDDLYVHSMDENEKIVKRKVVKLYREKINAPMKQITTANGKKITTTIPHKFYTLDGWKSCLTTDDYVCSSSNQFALKTNDFNDLNLTKLLAWQIGEGHELSKRSSVRITQENKSVLSELEKIYNDLNFSKSKIRNPKNKCSYLEINSKEYQSYLESLGYEWGHKSAFKRIPEFIMQSNDEVVRVFLKSYFDAECYVNPKCRQIEITSASEILIYQLSLLLQRFDILCSFSEKMKMATNGSRIKRKYHTLYVCGSGVEKFFKEISLDYDYKLRNYLGIKTKANSNKEGKPIHLVLKPFFKKYDLPYRLFNIPAKNYIQGKRFATNKIIENIILEFKKFESGLILEKYKQLSKSKWTNKTLNLLNSIKTDEIQEVINNLEKLKNNDLQYEKVKSVKHIDYHGYVYDLSIEETHNYISDNLICHNTVQLISAAALRMQEKNKGKSTLIVTLKATQKQWVKEILNVMGQDEMDDISTDGKSPKKWTVLYYENFSAGNDVKDVLEVLKNHGFAIAIFDELHKLKHKNSLRSENILYVTKDIPTKWGASATVSSNKPMDVLNQLAMVGHHLGNIDKKKFKRDFAPDDKQNADASIIAAENLNRWLNLSGVYVRRSKSDVKEMPNLDISKKIANFDQDKFNHYFNLKLSDYKNPDLPISRLIAARESIAHLKTNDTVEKAINIVSNNMNGKPAASKVVIFTNFTEAAEQLVNKISPKLKQLNPDFKVLTYLSNTKKKDRDQVKELFTNNDNAKVLVMSMKMGGTGIDFPNAAQNMLINDFDWTPESAEQSEGRIYRINTNHPVNIQYVVSDGLDSELYEKVQKKRRLASIIQKYRKEYQEKENDKDSLNKIVAAQKEINKIDQEMVGIINNQIPGAGNAMESFRNRLDSYEEMRDALLNLTI